MGFIRLRKKKKKKQALDDFSPERHTQDGQLHSPDERSRKTQPKAHALDSLSKRKQGGTVSPSQSSINSGKGAGPWKLSSSSSNESHDQKGTRRLLPDLRMFKLEKQLKVLEKMEEERLVAENDTWKAKSSPAEPARQKPIPKGSPSSFTAVIEESDSPESAFHPSAAIDKTKRPESSSKQKSGIFGLSKSKREPSSPDISPGISSTSTAGGPGNAAARRISSGWGLLARSDVAMKEDGNEHPVAAPRSQSASYAASDASPIEEKYQRRMTITSFRRDNYDGGSGDSDDNFGMDSLRDQTRKRKISRWLSSQSADLPGITDRPAAKDPSVPSSSRRPQSLLLRLGPFEQGGPAAFSKQRMMSIGEPVTPGISETPSFLTRRRAVRTNGHRVSATIEENPDFLPSPRSPYSPDSDADTALMQSPMTPGLTPIRKHKSRSYFGNSIAEAEVVVSFDPLDRENEALWSYRVRRDVEMEHGAAFGQTSSTMAAVRDVPDHLPNSPLCP